MHALSFCFLFSSSFLWSYVFLSVCQVVVIDRALWCLSAHYVEGSIEEFEWLFICDGSIHALCNMQVRLSYFEDTDCSETSHTSLIVSQSRQLMYLAHNTSSIDRVSRLPPSLDLVVTIPCRRGGLGLGLIRVEIGH
jgi:hypothetical protein